MAAVLAGDEEEVLVAEVEVVGDNAIEDEVEASEALAVTVRVTVLAGNVTVVGVMVTVEGEQDGIPAVAQGQLKDGKPSPWPPS